MSLYEQKIVPSSFSKLLLDQNTLVLYFESVEKSKFVNFMVTKVNLSLNKATNKKPQLKLLFAPIASRCLSAL